jgi:hypothetical protein
MTDERIYYSDANGVRVGTANAVFGEHTYATSSISSVSITSMRRRQWPGAMMMAVGGVLLVIALISDNGVFTVTGIVAFLSGSFYFSRKRPTFVVRIVTSKGPVLVVASKRRYYVEQVRRAVDKAIAGLRA